MQTSVTTNLTFTVTPLTFTKSRPVSRRRSEPVFAVATPTPPASRHQKLTHTTPPEKLELLKSLEPWAHDNVVSLLKPVEKSWQPNELLPDPTRPVGEFIDEVQALRDRTKELPDEYFVVLVGDMITEEALPTYQSMLNGMVGVGDETGSSPSPWAAWVRGWASEENRHGDLLRTFLYLSGRVDMVMVDKTMQYLIGAGMDGGLENNPYLACVYASFQERATFISHSNTGRLASEGGDSVLAKICGVIAADEKRHENAYIRIYEKLLEVDPNEAMVGIGKMLRKKITMPAHLLSDGRDPHLFEKFTFLANRMGVYTPDDYASIMEYLIGRWNLEKLEGLNADGMRQQEFVCTLPHRIRKLQARVDDRANKESIQDLKFSWLFNKKLTI